MESRYLKTRIAKTLLSLLFVVGIGVVSSVAVQAQWPNQDRDYGRDRRDDRYGRNGGYGGGSQIAVNQGYQDGVYTGENDARRGQNYNPQRSHYYRSGHGNNGSYGNNGRNGYEQAYRQGFLRGYDEGFRRYGGNNRRGNNRNNGRWPFPW
jgi:hypothetical protein